ncbi:helix-turn-helix domain-containing protein [Methylobacterium iners]|uniref:helix-turn-helix domain-containing protein n=1 Tax=Methylobacterium iners TaxID=418707 RepID=UPI0035A25F3A
MGWSRKDLAQAALISSSTLHRFEKGEGLPNDGLLIDVRQAFEAASIKSIPENRGELEVEVREP